MSTQLSLSQVATLLNVSEKSIRRYIKSGRMKAVLVKGQKGYEYRIDKTQIKEFSKPPRGKNSHLGAKNKTTKIKPKPKKTLTPRETVKPMSPIKEIIKENKKRMSLKNDEPVDYKELYEALITKYEQALIKIGGLESQLKDTPQRYNPNKWSTNEIANHEDLILELYQLLQLKQGSIEY